MSAVTVAMAVPPSESHPSSAQAASQNCCPSCGFAIPPAADDMAAASALLEAQRKIADLEAQVRLLNQKAAAAVDRWADYEDELAQLRRESQSQSSPISPKQQTSNQHQHPTIDVPSPPPSATLPPPQTLGSDLAQQQQQTLQPPPSPQRSSFSRLSALLTRKSVPNLQAQQQQQAPPVPKTTTVTPAHSRTNSPTQNIPAHPSTSSADTAASKEAAELAAALKREQSLRLAAERRVDDTSREVEELSVSLFEQANEMVAEERRARARLEERIEILEKRDVEKRRRLDRLEMAMKRIERVRGMLDKKEELGNDEVESGKEKEGEERRKMSL